MPDVRPSELVEIVRSIRAGGPIPEIPLYMPKRPHRSCQITCITDDEQGIGHWCPQCPYAA